MSTDADSCSEMAINLLHEDHASTAPRKERVAVTSSHDNGTPCTTLAKGWAYCSYSSFMADPWGDRGSAV